MEAGRLGTICRLFALHGGRRRLRATFWLLEAPDSLAAQSRRNPDGYGIGFFDGDGTPHVDKRPASAYHDEAFAREARELRSSTFVAHVRYASTGGWEFMSFSGNDQTNGKLSPARQASCASCHSQRKDHDSVFSEFRK